MNIQKAIVVTLMLASAWVEHGCHTSNSNIFLMSDRQSTVKQAILYRCCSTGVAKLHNFCCMALFLSSFQSRNLAASSQKLRDSLRKRYGGESFDQKVLKAELYNKLESSNFSSDRNISSVKLR